MKKVLKVLGIDLGGCMSGNSAYVYAHISDNTITIIEAMKEPRHKDHISCQHFLETMLLKYEVDVIAIDAPLSLPKALTTPNTDQLPREGSGEILNPYLFRYTDYFLYHTFQLRPMPPAGDRIGRLTARMVALLQKFEYKLPYITLNKKQTLLYEVYPKQIAKALGLSHYKQDATALFKCLNITSFQADEHLLDALLCLYGASKIAQGDTFYPPKEVEAEGWCFPLK